MALCKVSYKRLRAIVLLAACCPLFSPALAEVPRAAIASAHPLATRAGEEILLAGGNAFDAAVAITAALAVVEPYGSGIGGGGFWLLHREKSKVATMIDGRERAPFAAHRDMYLDENGEIIKGASIDGPLAAGIPGTPAAMEHLADRYGTLPLSVSLQPAIRYAQEGFAVDEIYQRMAGFRKEALKRSPDAARIFLLNGEVPPKGHLIKQPALGETLRLIAEQGSDGFYRGQFAERLVQEVKAAGGIWDTKDLAEYRIIERQPVIGEYRGMKIVSAAPPSSGGIAMVQMLNILAGYDLESLSQAQRVHLIVEAMRRAYRDRAEYLGDSDFAEVPLQRLTHPLYASGLRASIRSDRATPSAMLPGIAEQPGGHHTTHFSVIDAQGNRVAATLSINYPFGSGFMVPGTGVLLNDEMDDFSAKPGVPNAYGLVGAEANAIEPGKRMLSSMTPTFLESEDRIAVIGTPGGSRIITMVLLAALEFQQGADAKAMVERPRFHHQYLPDKVFYEPGALDNATVKALQVLGHELKALDEHYGNMQVVIFEKEALRFDAASDSRGIGRVSVIPGLVR